MPGFGLTKTPPRDRFTYSLDKMAEVVGGFVDAFGLTRYALCVFDYGVPVGFRFAKALRRESSPHLRVTKISPHGFIGTIFADASISDPKVKRTIHKRKEEVAISPDAIACAIAFTIEQPDEMEVGSIVIRQTTQNRCKKAL